MSIQQAEKIAAISKCWEDLISKTRSPSATAVSLSLHRITATSLLHKCGMGISYTDVRLLTNTLAKNITFSHKGMLPKDFTPGKSVHVTFDNSDGKQQTLTSHHTTHHTTGTIFQNGCNNENTETIESESREDEEATEEIDFGNYKISKKRKSIPSFPEYEDKYYNSDILDKSFQRDIAWALLNAVGNDCVKKLKPEVNIDELMEVGSWTAFMKDTTSIGTTKCKLEYLPVVPFPPSDNIVKWYMDMIVQLACVCACRRSNQ